MTTSLFRNDANLVGVPLNYTGTIPSVNRWHATTGGRGRAHIYETAFYKKAKGNMATAFAIEWKKPMIITYVDLWVTISLWKVRDTDGAIKSLQDALELSGVITDDKFIRNVVVARGYHSRDEPDTAFIVFTEVPEDQWPE